MEKIVRRLSSAPGKWIRRARTCWETSRSGTCGETTVTHRVAPSENGRARSAASIVSIKRVEFMASNPSQVVARPLQQGVPAADRSHPGNCCIWRAFLRSKDVALTLARCF